MPSLNTMAIRLYRRLFASSAGERWEDGVEAVLDGNSAVAVTEAGIAGASALGTSFPGGGANQAWRCEQEQRDTDAFGGLIATCETEGPRGALAAASGLAMAGSRATAFVSGQDIAAAQDLLRTAAGRHLPLVLHLENRTLAAQGGSLGSGHEAIHLSADSGFFTLVASNVQEAVDFTLIARRVAEQALVPGLVAMDGEQTAQAVQDVRLPSLRLAERFIGPADEQIPVPTDAQRLLFGETRRRVPIWHDLDNPVMHGALQGPESSPLGAVAQAACFEQQVAGMLEQAFAEFARQAGRQYGALSTHDLGPDPSEWPHYSEDNAKLVLVAQGAAIETARSVAGHLAREWEEHVGVIGIHCVRPFPAEQMAGLLAGRKNVVVLERVDTPLAGDAPLMRELRAALDRARENSRHGEQTHPGYPAIKENQRPRLRSVIYGLGGQPLRAADLIALCNELDSRNAPRLYLGVDLARSTSKYPKRQVLLDSLRRAYPEIADQGVRAAAEAPDLRPAGALSIAVHRVTGQGAEGLAVEAGNYLHRLVGGHLRSRPGLAWERWGACCTDLLTHAPEELQDVGDDAPVDFAIMAAKRPNPLLKPHAGLRDGGALMIVGAGTDDALWQGLSAETRAAIRRRNLTLYAVTPRKRNARTPGVAGADLAREHLLGALFKALLDAGRVDVKARRLIPARQEALEGLPNQEAAALLASFQNGIAAVRKIDHSALGEPARTTAGADHVPMAVRRLGGDGERHDSLPRFWDQVGILYRKGETDDLTADPYMAAGTVPPLTSTFRDFSGARRMLPAFDPKECTGCGKCWTGCPDGAIGAVALTPGALIDAGISATGAGTLRQMGSKIAGRISSQGRSGKAGSGTAGTLLKDAYAWLQEKAPLPADRKQAMDEAFDSVHGKLAALPVVLTGHFFKDLEAERKDSGALLSLAINPDACKSCGICIAVCEPGALKAEKQDAGRLDQAREIWNIWEATPDTPSEVIERVGANPEVGPMAAVLLSRFCAMAVAGGDGAEAGSGEKIAVRLALAATEYQQQPLVHGFTREVGETLDAVRERIREIMAAALPADDLDAILAGLDQVRGGLVDIAELTGKIEAAGEGEAVHVAQLRRLANLAKELTQLRWHLAEGGHGLGRARFGLAVAPGPVATWAGVFPNNPFQVPVAVDMTGDTAQMAAGLLEGQLREAVAAHALMRRARLELDQPSGIEQKRQELETLGWRDLTDEERALCPPLLLVGNDETLGGRGFAQVAWLLKSGLPVKVLVLADLDLGLDGAGLADAPLAAARDPKADLGLLAVAQRSAYVAQTSVAAAAHLRQSMREALKYKGPALIHVHVPSPGRHGFHVNQAMRQARLALDSRAFPLFRYDPQGEGVFGSRISLEGNPEPGEAWLSNEDGTPFTPAHWAITERRFAARFAPVGDEDPAPTALDAWLELDAPARRGKTPFISVTEEDGAGEVRYRIDPELADQIAERGQVWRTLQELAGVETPFAAAVEQATEARLEQAHEAVLVALKKEYEQQIGAVQSSAQAQAAAQVREQLLKIAGYK